jgi:peptidoglycan/LPS O-acetylase OafA/YrhL
MVATVGLDSVQRRPDLDGMRGVAVLLTIILHYVVRGGYFSYLGPPPVLYLLNYFWCGVDIFFVLSGYLIGGIVFDHGRADNFFRVFYLRRALRILPVALLALALSYLVIPFFANTAAWEVGVPPYAYFLFINNFWTAQGLAGYPPLAPMWSLAIEEQFYLIAPAFMLLAGPRVRTLALLGVVLLSPFLRLGDLGVSGWDFTLFRLDGFSAGILLAGLLRNERFTRFAARNRRGITLVVAGLAMTTLLISISPAIAKVERIAYGISLNSLTTAGVILFLHLNRTSSLSRALSQPWLTAVGRVSYFLYLMHFPIVVLVSNIQGRRGALQLLFMFGLCLLAAWASWRFMESKLIALGKKLAYLPPVHTTTTPSRVRPRSNPSWMPR